MLAVNRYRAVSIDVTVSSSSIFRAVSSEGAQKIFGLEIWRVIVWFILLTIVVDQCNMLQSVTFVKSVAMKKSKPALPEGNRSFTVRLTPELSAEVQKIAEARLWTFSKTLGVLIERAIAAKVLK
jgi:hypothetical protein